MLERIFLLIINCSILVYAKCNPRHYETMIGGYEKISEIEKITFDVNPDTDDLVVAGKNRLWQEELGFIYFV